MHACERFARAREAHPGRAPVDRARKLPASTRREGPGRDRVRDLVPALGKFNAWLQEGLRAGCVTDGAQDAAQDLHATQPPSALFRFLTPFAEDHYVRCRMTAVRL